jgi:putative nucleotidyltransferase with HDIG domain
MIDYLVISEPRSRDAVWPSADDERRVAALIARAAELDPLFPVHARCVAELSVCIARELDLADDEVEVVAVGAGVHDVGKLEVEPAIIAKPGELDASEWDAVRRHPAVGAELLERCNTPRAVVEVVRSHHERWDGAGYPDGLRGRDVPLAARIVAVADAYCAMLEDRPYRAALTPEDARSELRAQAGRQFDAICAEAACWVTAGR